MYIITNMGIPKLWGQSIDINTLYIQYELASAHIVHSHKSYTSVSNKFSTLNQDQNKI